MDSQYISTEPDEDTICQYFPTFRESPHQATNNKYFIIERKKKHTPRQANKGKLTKLEWFESLEVEERVDAISTVATDNPDLIRSIKMDIKKIDEKNCAQDNSVMPSGGTAGGQGKNDVKKISQNWHVSLTPEMPGCTRNIIKNFTLVDYKCPEDTISVLEDLVIDPVEFFHNIKSAWEEVKQDSEEHLTEYERKMQSMWKLTYGENYNEESKTL
jgi:hypothetical protein